MRIEISVKSQGINIEATLHVDDLVIWIRRDGHASERRELKSQHAYALAQMLTNDPIRAIVEMCQPLEYGRYSTEGL